MNSSTPDWLAWAREIRALAESGLHFGESAFDRERYARLLAISNEMLVDMGRVDPGALAALPAPEGYATPKVDVRGAVLCDGRVLLVRERSDDRWTLPGGFADVGVSPAANVEREILEEAGLRVRARRLYAVIHRSGHPYDLHAFDFYKLYFLCERLDDRAPAGGLETSDAAYFDPAALPPLSTGRVIASHVRLAFEAAADPAWETRFD